VAIQGKEDLMPPPDLETVMVSPVGSQWSSRYYLPGKTDFSEAQQIICLLPLSDRSNRLKQRWLQPNAPNTTPVAQWARTAIA
jgi:hypothetical protein